jgi:hypothetical protein
LIFANPHRRQLGPLIRVEVAAYFASRLTVAGETPVSLATAAAAFSKVSF